MTDISKRSAASVPAGRAMTMGLVLAAATLVGCSVLPAPPTTPALYDFGLATMNAAASSAPGAPVAQRRTLILDEVTAQGLPTASQALLYRFSYADDHQLRAYQQARWSQPVTRLLGQQLREQLERQGPVMGEAYSPSRLRDGDRQALVLRVELDRFEQVFTSESQSTALVQLRATLVEPGLRGDRLLGQRSFVREVPAGSADAPGGARALALAAQAVAADVDAWVGALAQQ
ncbi:ABC-type transport auxiliary lipoprotein family protein [Corticibacter populi]|nr:ABC-type transport auxiliary lipoprotein family protein [Corticibacter populi]